MLNITFYLNERNKKPFHTFTDWKGFGFKIGGFFQFRVFIKRYQYTSPWQERIKDHLKDEQHGDLNWDEEV